MSWLLDPLGCLGRAFRLAALAHVSAATGFNVHEMDRALAELERHLDRQHWLAVDLPEMRRSLLLLP